ncbi:MAG TPA: class I SAM-dependent methyltransferase [Streptosporangiaceae bacterium]|jgi:ubiquinone/menaquinone biosynthesis C-methylase UbiE
MAATRPVARRTDIYDDPDFNYALFWHGRDYEHHAEVAAIRRLLRGHRFAHAVDVGGGFGRLSVIIADYADKVTLVDPSIQQLELSGQVFPQYPAIDRRRMDAAHLQFADQSVDLVTFVRVLHHLPDPEPEFAELARILRPGGLALVEAANSAHARRRLRYRMRGETMPQTVIDIRSDESKRRGTAPYVNHHPQVIARQLAAVGLQVVRTLSVSNLRHSAIKAMCPAQLMLGAELALQHPLARFHFGPSVFFLLEKLPEPVAG